MARHFRSACLIISRCSAFGAFECDYDANTFAFGQTDSVHFWELVTGLTPLVEKRSQLMLSAHWSLEEPLDGGLDLHLYFPTGDWFDAVLM